MHVTTIPPQLSRTNVPPGQSYEETVAAQRQAGELRNRLDTIADRLQLSDESDADQAQGQGQVAVSGLSYRWMQLDGTLEYDDQQKIRMQAQHGADQMSFSATPEELTYQLLTPHKSFQLVENRQTGTLSFSEG